MAKKRPRDPGDRDALAALARTRGTDQAPIDPFLDELELDLQLGRHVRLTREEYAALSSAAAPLPAPTDDVFKTPRKMRERRQERASRLRNAYRNQPRPPFRWRRAAVVVLAAVGAALLVWWVLTSVRLSPAGGRLIVTATVATAATVGLVLVGASEWPASRPRAWGYFLSAAATGIVTTLTVLNLLL